MINSNMPSTLYKRCFSTTQQTHLFKSLNSTLKNTAPRQFEQNEIVKPVGQAQKPSATDGIDTRSLTQRKNDWLDNDNRLKRKANLEKEFATSGMYDMYIYRKTQGKVFLSPKSYFKREKALYFPNWIADENLLRDKKLSTYKAFTNDGKFGKVNIVMVCSTAIAQKHTQKYFDFLEQQEDAVSEEGEAVVAKGNYLDSNESYRKLLAKYPNVQVFNFTFYDNFFKKWLFKIFSSKEIIKKSVSDPEYLRNYYILNDKILDVPTKDTVQYLNGITGYVYVIDDEGRIRWLSSGEPTESDLATFWKAVGGVLAEVRKRGIKSSL